MKRQDRLALFFEHEYRILEENLEPLAGSVGLFFSGGLPFIFRTSKVPRFYTGSSQVGREADLIFEYEKWPFPENFFDVVVLAHPLDTSFELEGLLKEIKRVLKQSGTVYITGFNRARLCSWPIQKALAQNRGCGVQRYSLLKILSALDEVSFLTKVSHFDFCRFKFWNRVLARTLPFLGIGFMIQAKRQVLNLNPLAEMDWKFNLQKGLNAMPQPECLTKKNHHDSN